MVSLWAKKLNKQWKNELSILPEYDVYGKQNIFI